MVILHRWTLLASTHTDHGLPLVGGLGFQVLHCPRSPNQGRGGTWTPFLQGKAPPSAGVVCSFSWEHRVLGRPGVAGACQAVLAGQDSQQVGNLLARLPLSPSESGAGLKATFKQSSSVCCHLLSAPRTRECTSHCRIPREQEARGPSLRAWPAELSLGPGEVGLLPWVHSPQMAVL